MVALLVFRFNVDQSIPENTVAFYEDLFDLLLRRHDRSKAGYVRPRKSGAGDAKLHDLFNATSYLTRKADLAAFSYSQLQGFVKEAIQIVGGDLDATAILQDFIDITCLILEEGGECKFLHRSIQEFYAARFIQTRPEEMAVKFYRSMVRRWNQWQGELRFLQHIDRYRFLRYFGIPEMRRTLDVPEEGQTPTEIKIDSALVRKVYGSLEIGMDKAGINRVMVGSYPTFWFFEQLIDGPTIHKLNWVIGDLGQTFVTEKRSRTISRLQPGPTEERLVSVDSLLDNAALEQNLVGCFTPKLSQLHKDLVVAEGELRRFDQTSELFDL